MIATESGHWYTPDGEPAYTQPNKSRGGERPTTLRDAKKLGLLPSVTTIIKCAHKPALERWKLNQVAYAALTLPRIEGETEDDFLARVWGDSAQQAKDARDAGSDFHASMEMHLRGEYVKPEHRELCERVMQEIERAGYAGPWKVERSFASPLGYGGKVDLHSNCHVLDFKTKDRLGDKKLAWDDQGMQLAAYGEGLGLKNYGAANVYIGLQDEQIKVIPWTADELDRCWAMFRSLLSYWQFANGMVQQEAA